MGNDRARVGHARRGKKLRPDREFPAVEPLAAVAAAAAAPLLDCRVVDLARSAACVWTLGIAACYPTPDPPWLVTRTELIALRLEVKLSIELPKGAKLEGTLAPLTGENEGRAYKVADRPDGAGVLLDRVIDIPAGRVPPADYATFVKFARAADEAFHRDLTVRLP